MGTSAPKRFTSFIGTPQMLQWTVQLNEIAVGSAAVSYLADSATKL